MSLGSHYIILSLVPQVWHCKCMFTNRKIDFDMTVLCGLW